MQKYEDYYHTSSRWWLTEESLLIYHQTEVLGGPSHQSMSKWNSHTKKN